MPRRFRPAIASRYSYKAKKEGRQGANLFLLRTAAKLPERSYRLAADDSELVEMAERRAKACNAIASKRLAYKAIGLLLVYIQTYSIEPPDLKKHSVKGVVRRLCDPLWWRRALRKSHGRTVEATARDLGLVHKGAGIYSSDETLYRRQGQKSRNRRMLEEVLAVNEEGVEYTLAELSDLSVSNPVIRRGELMVRISGFESVADELGHAGEFITLTCPSRFHAYTIKNHRSFRNKKFDPDLTPREGQKYLTKVWSRIRAKLDRMNIRLYGFRVAEPNHCGCPHWHLLVFLPAEQREQLREVFLHYGLEDSPKEPGAEKHRVTFKAIDKGRGTAAGYIAKYIAKNIDGHALDADLFGGDPIEAAARVDAWAACWGVRQFQQVGGPPVSVWRELRRMDSEECGELEEARAAADKGEWDKYVWLMGGPTVKRRYLSVRPAYMQEINMETGELPLNKYGELSPGKVIGVRVGNVYHVTRWHKWEMKRNEEANRSLEGVGVQQARGADSRFLAKEASQGGSPAIAYGWERLTKESAVGWADRPAPWSSVNNCTRQVLKAGDSPPGKSKGRRYGT